MEDPGGAEGYRHGGWSFEIPRGDEGDAFKLKETLDSQALLLGRVTYEGFAEAWPKRVGEFADKFNNMPKYVVSRTLQSPQWTNSIVLPGADLTQEVAAIREQVDGDIVVHGSAGLVGSLIDADLLDELRLMVYPVVLGSGKRLFEGASERTHLSLTESKVVGDGVAILVYARA